jgi:hypothetical protein
VLQCFERKPSRCSSEVWRFTALIDLIDRADTHIRKHE